MNNRIIKYAFWALLTVVVMGLIVFLTTFDIFETSDKTILISKCDYEGLRNAEVYLLEGNAITNSSIHVSIHLGCDSHEKEGKEYVIFTADNSSIGDDDVKISWVTFDTLAIAYRSRLRIFTERDSVEFPDSTLNLNVTYNMVE